MSKHHLYTNRLAREKSPYLLQHAHNPVDWYPWGQEAFDVARREDKPVFLSIGYATCHWCHVMERESFEDPEVARLMNLTFINIKVDREELPEVDSLYMEFAQSMISGAVGWPLNLILTPELEPFFAATYLPPHNRIGMMGLVDLVQRIYQAWHSEDREKIAAQAAKIVDIFREAVHTTGDQLPEPTTVEKALDMLYKMADPLYGGIKGAPKFPIAYQLNFLLEASSLENDSRALFLAERTLVMMQRGGIYDHLGGGFSRYSVDERWLIPHFEKMLYDNAFLADAYLSMWQVNKRPIYRIVCEEILQYVLRTLTHERGGFFSAEDADSGDREGGFYTWSEAEIHSLLKETDSSLFCAYYGVTPQGNFQGRNVLHTEGSIEEFAAARGLDPHEIALSLETQKEILRQARAKNPPPPIDDKVLTGWNGLMIHAMATAGVAFNHPAYLDAAVAAAHFVRDHLWRNGVLYRRWREGEASFRANLDDYAFLIRSLLTLSETQQGSEWLAWALQLCDILTKDYKVEGGAFYQTDGSDTSLLVRKCHFADGAEPSGNAVHCQNLLRLYQLTSEESYRSQAEDILKAAKKFIDAYPPGYTYHIMNISRYYDTSAPLLTIGCNRELQHVRELRQMIFGHFIPHKTVIWNYPEDTLLKQLLPLTKMQVALEGKTALYLCAEGACQKPLIELSEMIATLHELG